MNWECSAADQLVKLAVRSSAGLNQRKYIDFKVAATKATNEQK